MMVETVTIPRDELEHLQERTKKLAEEKSYLQLAIHLMNRISAAPGLDNTIEAMLKSILDVIGATNIILYYQIDNSLYYADVFGKRMLVHQIDDALVQQVFDTRQPVEDEHAFANTQMLTPEFTKAYTWVFPLLVGRELIGVLKMENLHLGTRGLHQQLPTFFHYAALVLKNETLGHTRLKLAYVQLSKAHAELTKAMGEREGAEKALLKSKEELELRVTERNAELLNANGRLLVELNERERAEASLRESEARYRSLVETAQEGIGIVDLSENIVFVNQAFADMLGYQKKELVGLNLWTLAGEAEFAGYQQETRARRAGKSSRYETVLRHKNGEPRCFSVSASPLVDDRGDFLGTMGLLTDITEHKQAESERAVTIEILDLIHQENSRHELLRSVTTLLHKWSGCEAVGIRLSEGEDFPYIETRGFSPDFVLAENRLCEVDARGETQRESNGNPVLECMCGQVIRGRFDPSKPFFTARGSFWTNSTSELLARTTEADRQVRTRNRCNGEGYESVALIPLRASNETFGLLQLNDRRKDRFTPSGISLLERLSESVALGLAHRNAQESLRESTARLERAVQAGKVGLWDWDLRTNGMYLSPEWKRQIGYEDQEIGNDYSEWQSRVHPDDLDRCLQTIRAFLNKPWPDYRIEFRFRHRDGSYRWILTQASLILDDQGKAVRMLGSHVDITELRRAEESLRLRDRAVNAATEGICITGANEAGNPLVYVNRGFEALTGYSAEDVLGRNMRLLQGPATNAAAVRRMRAAVKAEMAFADEFVNYRKDGTPFWNHVSITPMKDRAGKVRHFVAVLRDVSQRKSAELAIEASRQAADASKAQYEEVVSMISEIVWRYEVDAQGKFISSYISPVAERLLGLPAGTIGNDFNKYFSYVHPEDLPGVREKLLTAMHTLAKDLPAEYRLCKPDGTTRWVRSSGSAHLQPDGRRIAFGSTADITERKLAEERLRKVERLRAEAEKLAATGRMAAQVAHEINNPLAGIKNSFRLIKDAVPENHPDHDMVGRIEREIDRIAKIVRQMYQIYSPRASKLCDIPVGATVRDVLELLEPLCREHEVTVEMEPVPCELTVWVPDGSLQQILYNLIANAVHASCHGGGVNVSADYVDNVDKNCVRISIRDQGHGIPAELYDRVFEPFFSVATADSTKPGLGLGLSIVKSIVGSVGGKIELQSTVGVGTTFRVYLPSKKP
jgi:PAS domain S-box-containing protein